MAFLDASLWNDLQYSDAFNEKRFTPLGLVDAVADSTPFTDYFLPPDARAQMASLSSLRSAKIPALKDQTVEVVSTPGFEFIPENLPESAVYSFVAYDVFSGFRHYPAVNANNMLTSEWQSQQVMMNVAHACGQSIESILAARAEERKTQLLNFTTQVSQGDGTYTFDGGTDTLNISKAAQKETMFYNLEQLMAANDLAGQYRLVNSRGGLSVQISEAAKYAANNEKNLQALGFLDQSRLYESNQTAPGSDNFNGWFFRDGALGMISNHPYDFRVGTDIAGRKWKVSNIELPFARMKANIYTNSQPTNADALVSAGSDSNLIMSAFEEMAIWFRFYVVFPYNSDLTTRANDVVKISGKTA